MNGDFFQKAFHHLVHAQVWIALCALSLTASTHFYFYHKPLSLLEGLFVFSITQTAYSFYYRSNPKYPSAKYWAIIQGTLSLVCYALLGFPKPVFLIIILGLAALYLLPFRFKNKATLLLRCLLLSAIWTLFPFYFSLKSIQPHLIPALFFTTRFFFVANLCFLFLIKDEQAFFKKHELQFVKQLLLLGQFMGILGLIYIEQYTLGIVSGILFLAINFAYYQQKQHIKSSLFYAIQVDGLMILECLLIHLSGYYH